jgi:hypothetical protein
MNTRGRTQPRRLPQVPDGRGWIPFEMSEDCAARGRASDGHRPVPSGGCTKRERSSGVVTTSMTAERKVRSQMGQRQ